MPWYYANNNQRLGPVSDSEFARLVREKIIRADTLVWRHGMADWKAYAEVAPTLPPPEVPLVEPAISSAEEAKPLGGLRELESNVARDILPVRKDFAGFWIRLVAKLVDWAILYVVSRQLAHVMGLADLDPMQLLQSNAAALEPYVQRIMGLALLDSAARLAFYWFFLKRFAATPGKMLLGLKVVSEDDTPLSHGQIVGRYFSEIVSKYFTLCIGYVVAAFDDEKRAMHDHFCRTRVVKKERT